MPKFQRLCIYANYQQLKKKCSTAIPKPTLWIFSTICRTESCLFHNHAHYIKLLLKTSWSIVEIKYPKYIYITLANIKPKSNI